MFKRSENAKQALEHLAKLGIYQGNQIVDYKPTPAPTTMVPLTPANLALRVKKLNQRRAALKKLDDKRAAINKEIQDIKKEIQLSLGI